MPAVAVAIAGRMSKVYILRKVALSLMLEAEAAAAYINAWSRSGSGFDLIT